MVLEALLSACSPRLRITSNNPSGVKLYPPCVRPLVTHHHLPGCTCSLYNTPDPTPTKHHFVVTLSLMAETMMMMMLRSGNDTMPPCKNLTTLGACSVTMMLRSANNTNLGNLATPLNACLVTTMPSLGDNTLLLGDDAMLLGNNPTPLGACSTTTAMTKPCSGDDAILGEAATPLSARLVTLMPSSSTMPHQFAMIPWAAWRQLNAR